MKNLLLLFAILSFPITTIAQDCIDESAINPGCICPLIYMPVCGCDGIMYDNSCLSQCAGVTSYVSAYDENGNLIDCSSVVEPTYCDLITVEFGGFTYSPEEGAVVLALDISSNLPNDVFYAYAGFLILDNQNQPVAYESADAANVYGFGGIYSETRYLVLDGLINFPFEGSVQLISGYFSTSDQLLECSFPINISFEGNENLAGQYYLDSEFDFIEITGNQFNIYDFEDDFLCYELIEFEYQANDSIIILTDAFAEEQVMMFYELANTLNLLIEGENFELVDTSFNADEWFECGSCYIYDVVAQAGECDSAGYFMVEIDFTVQNPQAAGFTVVGNGVTYGNFDYNQASYTIGPLAGDGITPYEFVVRDNEDNSCSDFYELGIVDCSGTTDIISNQLFPKKLLSIKNILGETITSPTLNTPYIYFYDDGSYEKKVIFVQ